MGLSYVIDLIDKVSGPANKSASAAEKLGAKLELLQKKMASLDKQKTLATSMGEFDKADKIAGKMDALGATIGNITPPTQEAAGVMDVLKGGIGALGPEAELAATLFKVEAAATIGLAAAFVSLSVAGLGLAEHVQQLRHESIAAFDALGEGKTTGEEVYSMLGKLSDSIGIARSDLIPLTKQFMAMGITSVDALQAMTTAALSAQALMGSPAAADAYANLEQKIQAAAMATGKLKLEGKAIKGLADMGVNLSDVAGELGMKTEALAAKLKAGAENADEFGDALTNALIKKGKDPLAVLGASTEQMTKKLREDFGAMFADIDMKAVMVGVRELLKIFEKSTASGQAMKMIITASFNAIAKVAAAVFPLIRWMLLNVLIIGLKAFTWVAPAIGWIVGLYRWVSSFVDIMATAKVVIEIVAIAAAVLAAIIGVVLVVAIGIIMGMVMSVIGIYLVFIGVIVVVIAAIGWLIGQLGDLWSALGNLGSEALSAAGDFIQGLINGITSGAGAVIDSVKSLGSSIVDAAKSALGISSPSKVFHAIGRFTTEGMAGGLDAGAPHVTDRMTALAKPPDLPARGGGGAESAAHGGGRTITVGAGAMQFNISGVKDADQLAAMLPAIIAQAFEQLQLQAGY